MEMAGEPQVNYLQHLKTSCPMHLSTQFKIFLMEFGANLQNCQNPPWFKTVSRIISSSKASVSKVTFSETLNPTEGRRNSTWKIWTLLFLQQKRQKQVGLLEGYGQRRKLFWWNGNNWTVERA